jgi:outer membrane autotransporter protein
VPANRLVVFGAALAVLVTLGSISNALACSSVTGISPASGPATGGTAVTITGSGFAGCGGASSVTFGGKAASFSVVDDSHISASSPPGTGTVDVTVFMDFGTPFTLTAAFTYAAATTDSRNLNVLEIAATKFVATASGAAITGAVDSAIGDAFGSGGNPVSVRPNGVTFNFAAEPQPSRRMQEAFDALSHAAGYTKAPPQPTLDRLWSAWADLRGSGFDLTDASGQHGSQINLTAGIGRKLAPDLLVGLFGGYENFRFTMPSVSGRMTGDGGTVGGYAAWRFAEHWRLDGKIGWSDISYNGTAGTASGSFTGSRWLGAWGLTGGYRVAGYVVEPSARIYTLWERDRAFTDTLGTAQASRDFSESRVSTGAKVLYPWQIAPDVMVSPYAGAYGDFRFSSDSALPVGVPFVGIKDGWSARVTSGLAFTFRNTATVSLGGELGGLGAGYDIWSANAKIMWPF